jgi:glycosyltransferase involved in cell wall biosynthesis
MHIAILNQDFPPETGAGPARITEMAGAWIARGHRVSVLTGFPNRKLPGQRDGVIPPEYRGRLYQREDWKGIDVHRSWLYASERRGFVHLLSSYLSFAATSLISTIALPETPDVLIASGPPYFQQFSGAIAAGIRGIPLVLEIRDLWPDYVAEMGIIRHPALLSAMFSSERWLLRQARATVVVTEAFRDRITAKGIARDSITVIPNGVDTSRYYACGEPMPILLPTDKVEATVGYLGTFGAGQALGAVVSAARQLAAQGRRIRFVLVGDGADRAGLEAELASDPIPLVSIHPPIPRDATRAFYNACDVVLVPHAALPVLGDTVPSKIFEVMACERPLVAALRGEGARIVERSRGGMLATPGDSVSIAETIARMLATSPEERAAMGAAGRSFAIEQYDRVALAERYLQLLERVTAT